MKKNNSSYIGIREIAQIANVSTATISRAINHPEKCSRETLEKVEKIIKEYNYIPNETIKNIFSKSSNTIAIFILDISNPFYYNLIMELNALCFDNHYTLLICDTGNSIEKEKAYLDFCIAKRCMGIVLTEGISNPLFQNISIPLVSFDRKESVTTSYVTSENYHSICKVIDYLYNLGHRRIAFVGPEHGYDSVEFRFLGYKDRLREKQIPFLSEYVFRKGDSLNTKLGKAALQYFFSLPQMPTAVICVNDMIALGLINEARAMNISIPDALSVCGFDHVLNDLFYPSLTTVAQDIPKIADRLFAALTDTSGKPIQEIIPSTFIPGQTCAKAVDSKPPLMIE